MCIIADHYLSVLAYFLRWNTAGLAKILFGIRKQVAVFCDEVGCG